MAKCSPCPESQCNKSQDNEPWRYTTVAKRSRIQSFSPESQIGILTAGRSQHIPALLMTQLRDMVVHMVPSAKPSKAWPASGVSVDRARHCAQWHAHPVSVPTLKPKLQLLPARLHLTTEGHADKCSSAGRVGRAGREGRARAQFYWAGRQLLPMIFVRP